MFQMMQHTVVILKGLKFQTPVPICPEEQDAMFKTPKRELAERSTTENKKRKNKKRHEAKK